VTGLKALNVNLAYCIGFAELKKAESDALLQFLNLHIHSADEHLVRWKWAVGSIAMWDNVRSLNRYASGEGEAELTLACREQRFIASYQAIIQRVQGEESGLRCLGRNVSQISKRMEGSTDTTQHSTIQIVKAALNGRSGSFVVRAVVVSGHGDKNMS
jgi:hypothetical protein